MTSPGSPPLLPLPTYATKSGWRLALMIAGLILTLARGLGLLQPSMVNGTEPLWTERNAAQAVIPTLEQFNHALVTLTNQLLPAVVSVRVYGDEAIELPKGHPPTPENHLPFGTGSGFIIRPDGLVLTNYHVIEKGTDVEVHLYNGDHYAAKVLGVDPVGDLALLHIEPRSPLPVAPLGHSSSLKVGELVVAIGSPFGFEHTITFGIVSGKKRHLLHSGIVGGFIQTDASINTGNSGGPLVNMHGEVVGINTATVGRGELGFAIPIDAVKEVLTQLYSGNSPARGWLGVQIRPLEPSKALSLGLDAQPGVYVHDVLNDQPAYQAGIQPGDVILQFDGMTVATPLDLQSVVAATPVGKQVEVQVYRKHTRHTVILTVGSMPVRE
jgi:S1-C subfamily serine protease